jgi:hypothetical protein
MTKIKAALIHLTLSVLVVGLLFLTILYIWYPKPFFEISGVIEPLKLLIMVDVIIGPLLTFVVYKQGKKSLKLDLSIIVLLQIAALFYGVYTIYKGRPSLIVMNNGQFHYLVEKYADNDKLKYDALKPGIFSSPKMAFLTQLDDLDIYSAYAEFEPIENFNLTVMPHSLSLDNMMAKFKVKEKELDSLNKKYKDDEIVFFILDKDQAKYYVVFSTRQNKIIDQLKF